MPISCFETQLSTCALIRLWRSLVVGGAVSLAALLQINCSDPCGPGSAAANGLQATTTDGTLSIAYTGMTAGANNDCPDPAMPPGEGVISLTIAGNEEGAVAPIVFCVPRPDKLQNGGLNVGKDFQVIDVMAQAGGCSYTLVRPVDATGTASVSGMCENGVGKAGFALTVDSSVTLLKRCLGMPDATVRVTLSGTIAVTSQ